MQKRREKTIFSAKKDKKQVKKKSVGARGYLFEILLGVAVGLFIIYYTVASFFRYDHFYTGRYDLGNMTQVVWNTANGNFFQMTHPDGVESVSRLAFHADFILILFAPFYFLWDSPKVLLLVQAVIAGMGAIFVYLIALKILKHKLLALLFAISYLLNPSVGWAVLFDFHPVVLATTFLLGAVYFLLEKRLLLWGVFALLAALTKEQVWFVVALFGPMLYFYTKKRVLGIGVFVVSIGIFYLLLWHVIPGVASSQGHFALSYFSEGGSSPSDIVKQVLFSPGETLVKFTSSERLFYLHALFAPLGYLSLLSPFWLLFSAPDFALNLLSDKEELHHIYYHYTAIITVFVYLSGIYGVRVLRRYIKNDLIFVGYLLFVTMYSVYTFGPLPATLRPNTDMFYEQVPQSKELHRVLRTIPSEKSVAASNELGAQLSHRKNIYTLGIDVTRAEYVAFFTHDPDPSEDAYNRELITQLSRDINYQLWYDKHGMKIFRKK
jgi:uncharacterized membrane protein